MVDHRRKSDPSDSEPRAGEAEKPPSNLPINEVRMSEIAKRLLATPPEKLAGKTAGKPKS